MSALLVKDAPKDLHQWLKAEASFNRRSLNQQVLICLEWCMQTYGEAQPRAPFVPASESCRAYSHGRNLASRLMSMGFIDDATARQMGTDAKDLRREPVREFDHACFA